jgi:hypothetical protein
MLLRLRLRLRLLLPQLLPCVPSPGLAAAAAQWSQQQLAGVWLHGC